jgi:hypothetical protein
MRAFSELGGKDLRWHVDLDPRIPPNGERHYVLYDAGDPVATAQAMWQRMVFFDFIVESGEGTYQVHMDLLDPNRPSVAWKTGEATSLAGFTRESEGSITAKGWISTASGRSLVWAPTFDFGYEYVVFVPGGLRMITVSAAMEVGIGGNPGHMLISPESAADPELPALISLSVALSNEQVLLLHRSARPSVTRRSSY